MKAFKWILASAVLCISSTLVAGESNGVIVSHYEPLQRLSFHTDSIGTTQKLRGAGPVTLSFDALGRSFDLDLKPHSSFLSAASRNALPDGVGIYRGQLAGNPDSWTRIVIYEGTPRGLVWDGEPSRSAFKWIVASAVWCISSTLVAGESNGVIVSSGLPLSIGTMIATIC